MKDCLVLQLTRTQQMALTNILIDYIRTPESTEEFIDCSTDPTTVTTPGQLLSLVATAQPQEVL
jgi:hypothetical protein